MDSGRVTSKEIEWARDVPVEKVAKALGYTVIKKGRYFSLKEMDSLMITPWKNRWWRYSTGQHGSSIDFFMEFGNYDFVDAVIQCLEINNIILDKREKRQTMQPKKAEEMIKKLQLPPRADNPKRLYAYLIKRRKLSASTVHFFINKELIYEEKNHHNIVFLGKDKIGDIKYAAVHGTLEREGQKAFRGDVEGNDKNYGVNLCNPMSKTVVVFEAVIDMMSYFELQKSRDNLLALGMVSDGPLETFLKENPQIELIVFALDHDEKGMRAMDTLEKKYEEEGYQTSRFYYPNRIKDVNDFLKELKGGRD